MDRKEKFLEYIVKINENELSKTILKPLFSSIYKCRVDFIGGVQEKGKDLIIFKKDAFNFHETIGVQVKKTKPTTNSQSGSLQQIITQLNQIKNEKVIDIESSNRISISKIFFVTPYHIPENILNHAQGAFHKIKQENAHIIDGHMIYEKVLEHLPSIIDNALGDHTSVWQAILSEISNEAVLKSLNYKKKKDISDIYCNISFSLNHNKIIKYVEQKISPATTQIKMPDNEKSQRDIDKINKTINKKFGISFYIVNEHTGLSEISQNYTKELVEKKKILNDLENNIEKSSISEYHSYFIGMSSDLISVKIDDLREELKSRKDTTLINNSEAISQLISAGHEVIQLQNKVLNLKSEISSITNNIEDKNVFVQLNIEEFCSLVSKLKYKVSNFDCYPLLDKLRISSELSTAFSFIESHEHLFSFRQISTDSNEITKEAISIIKKPIATPIIDVLDSGLDTLICGEAGSGKTTNLQAYALSLYKRATQEVENSKFTYYSTLNDLFKIIKTNNLNCISESIYFKINTKHGNLSLSDFKDKLTNEQSILILDSIDECISSHPETLEFINKYKNHYPKSQIITSSRHTVEKTLSLGFSCISILPFTEEQKFKFFARWFDKDESATEIMTHLNQNKELSKIIDNPLNATILAVLYDNGVKLPNTESNLYQRRFELLSGKLDQYKAIQRTTNTPDDLLAASIVIAYEMHKLKVSKTNKKTALKFISTLNHQLTIAESLFDELVSPCEIIHLNENGEYDFGHLKFQEFLASKDIDNRRSENFNSILKNISWWEQTLLLYAQHSRDIVWIVTYICNNGLIDKYYNTARKIVEASNTPEAAKEKLIIRLESAYSTKDDSY
jgi:RNase H-fold protein (predicted Holliday junction resolvase)